MEETSQAAGGTEAANVSEFNMTDDVYEATDTDIELYLPPYEPIQVQDALLAADPLFWQGMEQVRKAAYDSCDDMENANLLLCQYYRSKRDKFVTKNWNMLAGDCDYEFIAKLDELAQNSGEPQGQNTGGTQGQNSDDFDGEDKSQVLGYLTSQGHLIEPVNNERIELTHFFASLNLLIKTRQAKLHNDNTSMSAYVYDMGTWAGDCLELSAHILNTYGVESIADMSDEELNQVAQDLLCTGGGYFSRDNMLADMDAFNITASMTEPKMDLYQLMQDYYEGLLKSQDVEGNRFQIFVQTRYGASASLEDVIEISEQVLLSRDNVYIPSLRSSLGLDVKDEQHCRIMRAVARAFGEYVYP